MSARFAVCELVLRQGSFAADVAVAKAAGVGAIGVTAEVVDADGVHFVGGDTEAADTGRLGHGHVVGKGPLAQDQFAGGERPVAQDDRTGAATALSVQ